jgi:hypothetical protein
VNTQSLEDTHLIEGDAHVQSALPSKVQEYAVWPLLLEHVRDVICCDREEVDLVGELVGGLPCSDVRVYKDRGEALFTEGLHRLGARVVEFACLADGEAAAADDDYLLDVETWENRQHAG